MSESESSSSRKRSTAKTTEGEVEAQTYEQALEQGYVGGPADETDLTVAGVVAAAAAAEAGE
jgi:hypothetical protein